MPVGRLREETDCCLMARDERREREQSRGGAEWEERERESERQE